MHPIRKIKQKAKRLFYATLGLRPDIRLPVHTVNPGDQAWYFAQGSLKPGGVVYSLGLATNIEFDLNLIRDLGVEVHGFDPTASSVEYIRGLRDLPLNFHHHPIAVAGHNGELTFQMPQKEGHCARAVGNQVSGFNSQPSNFNPPSSALRHPTPVPLIQVSTFSSPLSITVPCRRLSALMKELGHTRIDCLKMDIEGSEYEVIEDILTNKLDIPQILVEFHHRFEGVGMRKTLHATALLRRNGYRLFHISPWCEEFAFLKE